MRRRKARPAVDGSAVPPVGGWRTAHGSARSRGADRVFEPVADGVRPVPPGAGAPPPARKPDGTFTRESAVAAAKRGAVLRRLPDFGSRAAPWLPPADALAPFDAARQDLLRQRWDEVHRLTGEVSSGVGAQLRAWAYIHAAGEYWASQFFASGDTTAFQRMTAAFKASSTEDAKLRDAAAWEAKARAATQSPAERFDFRTLAEDDQ